MHIMILHVIDTGASKSYTAESSQYYQILYPSYASMAEADVQDVIKAIRRIARH
jgi:hypothetical protein